MTKQEEVVLQAAREYGKALEVWAKAQTEKMSAREVRVAKLTYDHAKANLCAAAAELDA